MDESADVGLGEADGIVCATDAIGDTEIVADDGLSNDPMITTTRVDESGQQIIIVSGPQDFEGVSDTSIIEGVDSGGLEPPAKKIRIQHQDGQTYILAVTDSVLAEHLTSDDPNKQLMQEVDEVETDVSQAWFTTKDDKSALQNKGHSWKQGQWSREEVDILSANIARYCKDHGIGDPTEIIFEMSKDERKDFYRSIARGLERPLFSVYRRVIRMYDQRNHIGKYSPEEIQKLKELRSKHGTEWATIGAALGRSASSVKDRCRLMKDTCNSGKWLPDEERRLAKAVYELTKCKPGDNITTGLSWASVAEQVQTRSEKQCRTKWLNYLNWKQKGGSEWTREDDITLVIKIAESDAQEETQVDWSDIAKGWASVRSPQWLRGKWWSLKRHVPDYQLLPFTEIVECLKNLHTQNLRLRAPTRVTVPNVDFNNLQVPVIVTGTPNDAAFGQLAHTSAGDSIINVGDSAVQAFEIVPGLTTGGLGQGAFLITQPQLNPGITFAAGQIPTDHIIVHTLPMQQPTAAMNQQVIISAVPGQDGLVNVTNMPNIVHQTDEDLQVLPESAQGSAVEVKPETSSVAATELPTSLEEDSAHEQVLVGGANLDSRETEGIVAAEPFETQVLSGDVGTTDLEGVVCVSTSDMVLAISASPQFTQATGTLIHMSSLSDPMLTCNEVDLMGSSSDVEAEKVPTVEDPDVEREVDSPAT